MLLGVPTEVKRFFSPVVKETSKPIRKALAATVLAFLLAPHYRRLKTVAGMVLGHRVHVSTISRRLVNPNWKTRDWYVNLYQQTLSQTNRWEQRVAKKKTRNWIIVLDTTYHGTVSECMENTIVMPRRSYYTKEYCRKHGKKYCTLNQLAALMLREVDVPDDVDVTVTFDSALDANLEP